MNESYKIKKKEIFSRLKNGEVLVLSGISKWHKEDGMINHKFKITDRRYYILHPVKDAVWEKYNLDYIEQSIRQFMARPTNKVSWE